MFDVQIEEIHYRQIGWEPIYPQVSSHYGPKELHEVLGQARPKSYVKYNYNRIISNRYINFLNVKYPEEMVADPMTDLQLMFTWGVGRQYPFLGKYLPLNIQRGVPKSGSNSAKEALGSCLMGFLIENLPFVKPIVRNVQRNPDLICLGNNSANLVQFWEAKCQKQTPNWQEYYHKIYNELRSGFCNEYYFVRSKIKDISPIKVDMYIDKFFLKQPKKINSIVLILESLSEEIQSNSIINQTNAITTVKEMFSINDDDTKNDFQKKALRDLIQTEDAQAIFKVLDKKVQEAKEKNIQPQNLDEVPMKQPDVESQIDTEANSLDGQTYEDLVTIFNCAEEVS